MKKQNKNYKLISTKIGEEQIEYKVVDQEGFAWGKGKSIKGAVIGALVNQIRLNNIDFNGYWVPVYECIAVVK